MTQFDPFEAYKNQSINSSDSNKIFIVGTVGVVAIVIVALLIIQQHKIDDDISNKKFQRF